MLNIQIISDFTATFLKPLLERKILLEVSVSVSDFGQVFQSLSQPFEATENLIVFSRIENTLPEFKKLISLQAIDEDVLRDEILCFAKATKKAAQSAGHIFLFSWFMPFSFRGYGMSDYRKGMGVRYYLNLANNLLAEALSDSTNVFILDTERLLMEFPSVPVNNKLWYSGKIAFSVEFMNKCADELTAAIEGVMGRSRRLIVVDLDNTLWGGILGDLGWEQLRLGGHDHIGEAHVAFQHGLQALNNKGIILAIASKNYEENALNAIASHSEMVLRKDNFATWRINWEDKAQNIIDIASDVNLKLPSVVFIDDNPAERGRVKEALPDVLVPDWPECPTDYLEALNSLTCFDLPGLTKEDASRSKMFAAERERKDIQRSAGSEDDWLRSIDMKLEVLPINKENKARVVQLFNKTNQFNLATRRMSENALMSWLEEPGRYLWAFKVSDKFGDSGITGIVTLEIREDSAEIIDFIMSCRVMGRKIEECMLAIALNKALEEGAKSTSAQFVLTQKNKPILDFMNRSIMQEDKDGNYLIANKARHELPDCIELITNL